MPSGIWLNLTPCCTHSPFALQILGFQNRVVLATNSEYTKPRARIFAPGEQHIPNHMPTHEESPVTSFHKRTPWYLMWLNHATAIASVFQYSSLLQLYQQRCCTIQYSLVAILHTMVCYCFHCISWLTHLFSAFIPFCFLLVSQSHVWSSAVHTTISFTNSNILMALPNLSSAILLI